MNDQAPADPHDLSRFVEAQEGTYPRALSELRAGHKRSHWMWYIFPQAKGLGQSATSAYYGIAGAEEARAYLAHPVLGPRLRESVRAVLALQGLRLSDIFGYPDDLKFCSSMTLFDHAAPRERLFREALDRYCGGRVDERTLEILAGRR